MSHQQLRNPYLDFLGADGVWHSVHRCSIASRYKLSGRITQLYSVIERSDRSLTVAQLYDQNDYFQFLCTEALKLANVDPEWVNVDQLETLLFNSEQCPFGALVEFNFGYVQAAEKTGNAKAKELGEVIANLWQSTGDLESTLTLLYNLPCDVTDDMLEALKPQEKKWQDMAQKAYDKLTRQSDSNG